MNIPIFGIDYVGSVRRACLTEVGYHVVCMRRKVIVDE